MPHAALCWVCGLAGVEGLPLCRSCLRRLPKATRDALWRRDQRAPFRALDLWAMLQAGVPLDQIVIG